MKAIVVPSPHSVMSSPSTAPSVGNGTKHFETSTKEALAIQNALEYLRENNHKITTEQVVLSDYPTTATPSIPKLKLEISPQGADIAARHPCSRFIVDMEGKMGQEALLEFPGDIVMPGAEDRPISLNDPRPHIKVLEIYCKTQNGETMGPCTRPHCQNERQNLGFTVDGKQVVVVEEQFLMLKAGTKKSLPLRFLCTVGHHRNRIPPVVELVMTYRDGKTDQMEVTNSSTPTESGVRACSVLFSFNEKKHKKRKARFEATKKKGSKTSEAADGKHNGVKEESGSAEEDYDEDDEDDDGDDDESFSLEAPDVKRAKLSPTAIPTNEVTNGNHQAHVEEWNNTPSSLVANPGSAKGSITILDSRIKVGEKWWCWFGNDLHRVRATINGSIDVVPPTTSGSVEVTLGSKCHRPELKGYYPLSLTTHLIPPRDPTTSVTPAHYAQTYVIPSASQTPSGSITQQAILNLSSLKTLSLDKQVCKPLFLKEVPLIPKKALLSLPPSRDTNSNGNGNHSSSVPLYNTKDIVEFLNLPTHLRPVGNYHLLSLGIKQYKSMTRQPRYLFNAVDNAKAVASTFASFGFKTTQFFDSEAIRSSIYPALSSINTNFPNATLVIYFSGHTEVRLSSSSDAGPLPTVSLCPYDWDPNTSVNELSIQEILSACYALRQVVFIMDSKNGAAVQQYSNAVYCAEDRELHTEFTSKLLKDLNLVHAANPGYIRILFDSPWCLGQLQKWILEGSSRSSSPTVPTTYSPKFTPPIPTPSLSTSPTSPFLPPSALPTAPLSPVIPIPVPATTSTSPTLAEISVVASTSPTLPTTKVGLSRSSSSVPTPILSPLVSTVSSLSPSNSSSSPRPSPFLDLINAAISTEAGMSLWNEKGKKFATTTTTTRSSSSHSNSSSIMTPPTTHYSLRRSSDEVSVESPKTAVASVRDGTKVITKSGSLFVRAGRRVRFYFNNCTPKDSLRFIFQRHDSDSSLHSFRPTPMPPKIWKLDASFVKREGREHDHIWILNETNTGDGMRIDVAVMGAAEISQRMMGTSFHVFGGYSMEIRREKDGVKIAQFAVKVMTHCNPCTTKEVRLNVDVPDTSTDGYILETSFPTLRSLSASISGGLLTNSPKNGGSSGSSSRKRQLSRSMSSLR